MEIGPIPNLIPVRISAPSATPPDVPTTRAIDFRRQQEQEQDDATYTPATGSEEENDLQDDQQKDQHDRALEALEASLLRKLDAPEEPGDEHFISVFA